MWLEFAFGCWAAGVVTMLCAIVALLDRYIKYRINGKTRFLKSVILGPSPSLSPDFALSFFLPDFFCNVTAVLNSTDALSALG